MELCEMSSVEEIRRSRPVDLYRDFKSPISEQEFRSRCGEQAIWHSVDLGDTFIEGARKTSAVLAKENNLIDWPDVRGKSVLDIGALGGWFSFEAERRGAAAVTAVDYYSWCYDWPKINQWVQSERAAGRVPDTYNPPAWAIDEVAQPGRRAFEVTKEILGSKVTPVLAQVEEFESDPFDLVLYLGVLYHTRNPFYSLSKVAALTKDQLILETLGIHLPGQEERPLWEFFNSDQVNTDKSTWWAPNDAGLRDMVLACGFDRVEIKAGAQQLSDEQRKSRQLTRIWVHAWK
jgi:tRNA (mo5U34)-methyltransferase